MSCVDTNFGYLPYHDGVYALGPGKADLLDGIIEKGSISAAAKTINNDESEQSARLLLNKALSTSASVYGSVSSKVDAPSIRQLYESRGGNDNLGFQCANHVELGFKKHWHQADLNVAFCHFRVYDFIERNNNTDEFENRQ